MSGRSQEALQRELAESDAREMELYLRKSYYKTASLICDASRSCALLAGHASDSEVAAAAEEYGYHLGLALQIVDARPGLCDGRRPARQAGRGRFVAGSGDRPILFAAQDHPELRPLMIDGLRDGDGHGFSAETRGLPRAARRRRHLQGGDHLDRLRIVLSRLSVHLYRRGLLRRLPTAEREHGPRASTGMDRQVGAGQRNGSTGGDSTETRARAVDAISQGRGARSQPAPRST